MARLSDIHFPLMTADAVPQPIPAVVRDAIHKAFPKDALEILRELRWNRDHFYFRRWGMYVGVERDGYIHT